MSETQFSLTRATSIKRRRAKKQILISKSRKKISYLAATETRDPLIVREGSQLEFSSKQIPEIVETSPTKADFSSLSPKVYRRGSCSIYWGDALDFYRQWARPTVIISDGAYGLGSFPGDPPTTAGLEAWYRPHVEAWTKLALPSTTLWFWNSELGWATVHPLLTSAGWEYRCCHIWDKGIAHIAGNANTKTLRKFPVVTEVCVQYVKKTYFEAQGMRMTMQEWLRHEWIRAGLPLWKTNQACGVKNAATRKYFTTDHLWHFPPPDAFDALVRYANAHGKPTGRPYFSLDGQRPLTGEQWSQMRAKFTCSAGVMNVWREPAVRGIERLKDQSQCVHMNQKPLKLLELCLKASSDEGDVVWEPFGGLCSATLAAHRLKRRAFAAESVAAFYQIAVRRLENYAELPLPGDGVRLCPAGFDCRRAVGADQRDFGLADGLSALYRIRALRS
ncbi:MAG: DNA methyltransferase [Verrucomicrobiota bacterium]